MSRTRKRRNAPVIMHPSKGVASRSGPIGRFVKAVKSTILDPIENIADTFGLQQRGAKVSPRRSTRSSYPLSGIRAFAPVQGGVGNRNPTPTYRLQTRENGNLLIECTYQGTSFAVAGGLTVGHTAPLVAPLNISAAALAYTLCLPFRKFRCLRLSVDASAAPAGVSNDVWGRISMYYEPDPKETSPADTPTGFEISCGTEYCVSAPAYEGVLRLDVPDALLDKSWKYTTHLSGRDDSLEYAGAVVIYHYNTSTATTQAVDFHYHVMFELSEPQSIFSAPTDRIRDILYPPPIKHLAFEEEKHDESELEELRCILGPRKSELVVMNEGVNYLTSRQINEGIFNFATIPAAPDSKGSLDPEPYICPKPPTPTPSLSRSYFGRNKGD